MEQDRIMIIFYLASLTLCGYYVYRIVYMFTREYRGFQRYRGFELFLIKLGNNNFSVNLLLL